MKTSLVKPTVAILALSTTGLFAGEVVVQQPVTPPPVLGFEDARRPISNPTLFDTALPGTKVHAIFMHHRFPDGVGPGAAVPLGGDLNLYAVQLEYAFNERLSLVATKDGYIDFNPDATFTDQEGFANLAAGLKYAFIYQPENQYVMSGSAVLELPTGNGDVFQGNGDGQVNLSLQNLKLWDAWQLATSVGVQVPFDDDFSTQLWASAHLSYEITPWFIPLVEVNWFTVLDEGNTTALPFEGADLINWGATAGGDNDYATMALGFRSRLTESVNVGFAYEFPLTDEEDNITDDRFTLDLVWEF